MTITDVKPHHIDEILAIEKLCFSLPWTRRDLENQMNSDNCIFLAAEDETGKILGYIGLMHILDEGYISNVAVAPEYRRRGIADALINALIDRTKARLSFLTLEVRESNSPAIALYSKHGFKPVGIRRNYYDRPKENAVLMTLFFDREENLQYADNVN